MDQVFTTNAVANELGVPGQRIAGWRKQYNDTPEPQYQIIPDLSPGWSVDGIQEWREWMDARGL